MVRPAVILDTETTSLTPSYADSAGTIWEIATVDWHGKPGREHLWRMPANVETADPKALEIGHYYERTAFMVNAPGGDIHDLTVTGAWWSDPAALAVMLAVTLQNVTLIGAVPNFDDGYLAAFLSHYGQKPRPWHYRLRDIGSMAWAFLKAQAYPSRNIPPLDASTDEFAAALGVDPGRFERHSALGDCRLVAAMLTVIEEGPR